LRNGIVSQVLKIEETSERLENKGVLGAYFLTEARELP
jgi:hypothetical protein